MAASAFAERTATGNLSWRTQCERSDRWDGAISGTCSRPVKVVRFSIDSKDDSYDGRLVSVVRLSRAYLLRESGEVDSARIIPEFIAVGVREVGSVK